MPQTVPSGVVITGHNGAYEAVDMSASMSGSLAKKVYCERRLGKRLYTAYF